MTQAAQDPVLPDGSGPPASPAMPPSAEQEQQRTLEERYGRGRGRRFDRRFGWLVAAVLLAAGLIVLWNLTAQTTSTVEFRDLAYEVVDDRTVEIDFEISAQAGSIVACELEALSASYAQLGWKILELDPSDQRTRRFTETLVTTGPATTGYVKKCWIQDS